MKKVLSHQLVDSFLSSATLEAGQRANPSAITQVLDVSPSDTKGLAAAVSDTSVMVRANDTSDTTQQTSSLSLFRLFSSMSSFRYEEQKFF